MMARDQGVSRTTSPACRSRSRCTSAALRQGRENEASEEISGQMDMEQVRGGASSEANLYEKREVSAASPDHATELILRHVLHLMHLKESERRGLAAIRRDKYRMRPV